MSIFSSAPESRLGSLGIPSFIPSPPLPNIVAEWTAILPLACHLATQRDDYLTTGDVALLGRLSVGLFPRLGTLSGLSRLLGRGTKYLDHASTRGGSSRTVWDVKWGSVFPCANGAACTAISKCLMSQNTDAPQRMPEKMPPKSQGNEPEKASSQNTSSKRTYNPFRGKFRQKDAKKKHAKEKAVRRPQILHVYQLYQQPRRRSLRQRIDQLRLSVPGRMVWFPLVLCVAVFFCLLGSYGSAALIVCTSVSELVALGVTIRRPALYLENNENHDACMLVASHENAIEWHLYIGDRAVADTLLNKAMFAVPEGNLPNLASRWFWFANLIQFTAMTFVAAQKGWDGVCMVFLLAFHWAFRWSLCGGTLAHGWLEREGVEAKVRSFEFSGRTAMMGAIQVFSGSGITSWMDNILVPHPRREAWLKRLRGERSTDVFDLHDTKWLEFTTEASFASAEVLKSVFGVDGKCKAPV